MWGWNLSHVCSTLFRIDLQKVQKEGRPPNFHEVWSEETQCIKDLQKRKL